MGESDLAIHWGWLLAGFLIIAALSFEAWRSVSKLRKQTQSIQAHRQEWLETIQILARAYHQGQMGMVEAGIRLAMSMRQLKLKPETLEPYQVYFQVMEATGHIPTHEAWKALPLKQRMAYEWEMQQLEEKYGSFFDDATRKLLDDERFQPETSGRLLFP